MLGGVGPVVAPADDEVAAGGRVAVIAEIAAFKFKFDQDALPALGADLAFGLAIGEAGLNRFHNVAKLAGNHAEEKDDALFVDGFMAESAKIDGTAKGRAVLQRRMFRFAWPERKRRRMAGGEDFTAG